MKVVDRVEASVDSMEVVDNVKLQLHCSQYSGVNVNVVGVEVG